MSVGAGNMEMEMRIENVRYGYNYILELKHSAVSKSTDCTSFNCVVVVVVFCCCFWIRHGMGEGERERERI